MSKASENTLAALHAQLAESLKSAITVQHEDVRDEEGTVVGTKAVLPSPASLAVAAKFLKDNSITCDPSASDAMQELSDQLKNRSRAVSKQDLKDALRQVSSDLLQ